MAELGETLCHNCSGACCRESVILLLSVAEKTTLEDAGTKLGGYLLQLFPEDAQLVGDEYLSYEEYCDAKAVQLRSRHWFNRLSAPAYQARNLLQKREEGTYPYIFESDCALLDTSASPPVCSVYGDPSRPQACDELASNSSACREIREVSPHSVAVHIAPRREAS